MSSSSAGGAPVYVPSLRLMPGTPLGGEVEVREAGARQPVVRADGYLGDAVVAVEVEQTGVVAEPDLRPPAERAR